MPPSGTFTTAQEQLREKAMPYLAFGNIPISTNCHQFFGVMISAILMYNSEFWGAYLKSDFDHWDRSPIEKVHFRFCK